MKLNEREESIFDQILRGELPNNLAKFHDLYEKVEISLSLSSSEVQLTILDSEFQDFALVMRSSGRGRGMVIFTNDSTLTEQLVTLWSRSIINSISVRVERSWKCYIKCNGSIFDSICDEDSISTKKCQTHLRRKCRSRLSV